MRFWLIHQSQDRTALLGMLFSKQRQLSRKRTRGVMSLSRIAIPFMDLRYGTWDPWSRSLLTIPPRQYKPGMTQTGLDFCFWCKEPWRLWCCCMQIFSFLTQKDWPFPPVHHLGVGRTAIMDYQRGRRWTRSKCSDLSTTYIPRTNGTSPHHAWPAIDPPSESTSSSTWACRKTLGISTLNISRSRPGWEWIIYVSIRTSTMLTSVAIRRNFLRLLISNGTQRFARLFKTYLHL